MDKHIIVLNGKRYNAVTGELIGAAEQHGHARSHHAAHKPAQAKRQTSHHEDQTSTHHESHQKHEPEHSSEHRAARAHRTREQHGVPRHAHAHKPQAAQTLVRRAVRKPNANQSPSVKVHYPVVKTESGITVDAPKRLAHQVDDSRIQRAQKVHKSPHVGRFQPETVAPLKSRAIAVNVATPSTPITLTHHAEAYVPTTTPITPTTAHIPVAQPPQHQPAAVPVPSQQAPKAARQASEHQASHAAAPSHSHPAKPTVFEQALQSAKSHEQPAPKAKKRRLKSVAAGLAAVVVLGGFVTMLNQSAISLQLASVRAGFQAGAPGYTPAGFKQDGASVQGKAVSINYISSTDSRTYTLTQESSNWDSQTLFDSIVTGPDVKYQLIQNNGRNIYIYGQSQAAWVDGGVLYRISGNADLDGNDIVSIASSL